VKINDLYSKITEGIIDDLVAGCPPWLKPWKATAVGGLMPHNAATGSSYHGINIPILWDAAQRKSFPSHQWMTFKQALNKGGCVRQGEKSTHIVFVKRLSFKKKDSDEITQGSMLRCYSVFNVTQIDGLPEPDITIIPPSPAERHAAVEAFIAATKASIHHGGDMAAYVPLTDYITMPRFEAFNHDRLRQWSYAVDTYRQRIHRDPCEHAAIVLLDWRMTKCSLPRCGY
jgi:antirestriction protein ArdC